jgi:putative hydrolase of the HAD superfamily
LAIRFVYFDCMETLIQIDLPSVDAHADFAWKGGADVLDIWDGPEAFHSAWKRERDRLNAVNNRFREGTIHGRIRNILAAQIIKRGLAWDIERLEDELQRIHDTFWKTYRSCTYVLPEVQGCLDALALRRIPMGIVSNFMVPGGIQDLLALHHLDSYFREVVVSCHVGWRKPSELIYRAAIEAAGTPPGEILFIGDSPETDYKGPQAAGMEAILYDRKGDYPGIDGRITNLLELKTRLE